MEEKVLITSNNSYARSLLKTSRLILFISAPICLLIHFLEYYGILKSLRFIEDILFYVSFVGIVISLPLFIFSIAIAKTSITVTDKRVFGTTTFGKRVDLPFDSISAIGMSAFKGIAIGTSSGKISFKGIGNRDEIHSTINQQLVNRQSQAKNIPSAKQEILPSNADELKKYKDLLDSGVITQEEFDAKKKQILGL